MMSTATVIPREVFIETVSGFFEEVLGPAVKSKLGMIEIRTFQGNHSPKMNFYESCIEAAACAYTNHAQRKDVYFGINPRTGMGGRKENVEYISAFHAEIDYGDVGHKKISTHATYEEALTAIQSFHLPPSIVVHSGGGLHVYWLLNDPIKVSEVGLNVLEGINKELCLRLGGDQGTHYISLLFRPPATSNNKIAGNPRPVTLVSNTHRKYSYEDFKGLIPADLPEANEQKKSTTLSISMPLVTNPVDIDSLLVSDRTKNLITHGNDGTYRSRSEADMAVVCVLVNKGIDEAVIKQIFLTQRIGDKYRNHKSPDAYLKHTIENAKKLSDLTEGEMADPMFLSGAICKNGNDYKLNSLKLEEHIVKTHRIRILAEEQTKYIYTGKCYKRIATEYINWLCQNALRDHRELFTKATLSEVLHYSVADALVDSDEAAQEQLKYLTFNNGLFDLDSKKLILHSPEIFTTNLLPYDYDPDAECPRFIKFTDEIMSGDQGKISFLQESAGYILHKALPTPFALFLIGEGDNGKSVLLNTLISMIGEKNKCTINFSNMSNEKYIIKLFQKMLNVTTETPNTKIINTDVVKAVTAGDWVTGRDVYESLINFRPYAKHFLAMNTPPVIKDTTHGMWRRLWVINFTRQFKPHEIDKMLEEKLRLELSGIFNWALEGYWRLRDRGFAFEESTSMRLDKKGYRDSTNSVRSFANDNMKYSENPDDRCKFSELYKNYENYCHSEGIKEIESKLEFKKILKSMNFKIDNSSKDGNQVYVFNVCLIS